MAYDSIVKEKIKNNSESDIYYKMNIAGGFYSRRASPDSVFKYVYQAIHDYPVYNCGNFRHGLGKTVNSVYPKQVNRVCMLCDSIERGLDSAAIKLLVEVRSNDLKYRGSEHEPWITGKEETAKKQHVLDSLNQMVIEKLITKKKRYIGYDIVGYELADVAFMVIQHAPLAYEEKYLPMVEKAIKDKTLYQQCYPLLIDRIYMLKGLPQIFGTQVVWNKKRDCYELYKVQDLAKVPELRKKYGLNTLAEYLRQLHAVIPPSDKGK